IAAIDATPKPVDVEKPRFHAKWLPEEWGGKVIEDAPLEIVKQYVEDLQEKIDSGTLSAEQLRVTEATHAEATEIYLSLIAELSIKQDASRAGQAATDAINKGLGEL